MNSIVVFCGSSAGNNPVYAAQAQALGQELATQHIKLIYGGAKVGIMGAIADAVLQHGGEVTGVIPGFLRTKEVAHNSLQELIVTENMHERKMKMHELSDGIITLPGGWGTMEELFEMLTWAQLGLHTKPIGILNTNGYYNSLIGLCDHMVNEGFLPQHIRQMMLVADDVSSLIAKMKAYVAPQVTKWLNTEGT